MWSVVVCGVVYGGLWYLDSHTVGPPTKWSVDLLQLIKPGLPKYNNKTF